MPYPEIQRNRYADDTGNQASSHSPIHHEQDIRSFHLPSEAVQNSSYYTSGVARGLEVSGVIGIGTEVIIQPGVAIDAAGRMIVLADSGRGDIGTNPPGGQHNEVPVPVALGFGSHTGLVYITIRHSEILRITEGPFGRLDLIPWIQIEPVADFVPESASVVLAVAEINDDGALLDLQPHRSDFTYGRRVIGHSIGGLEIRHSERTGDTVAETVAGRVDAGADGGLGITVPNPGDTIVISNEAGDNFSELTIRADTIRATAPDGSQALHLDADDGHLTVGGTDNIGNLSVLDDAGRSALALDGGTAVLQIGAANKSGTILLSDNSGSQSILLDGSGGQVQIGTLNNGGELIISDNANRQVIRLDSGTGTLNLGASGGAGNIYVRDAANRQVMSFDGIAASLRIGTTGQGGEIYLTDSSGRQTMTFVSDGAALYLGANGSAGDLFVRDSAGRNGITLGGHSASVYLGTNGNDGDLILRDNSGRNGIHLEGSGANLLLGTSGNGGAAYLRNSGGNNRVIVDGQSGDVRLWGRLRDGNNNDIGLTRNQKVDLTDRGTTSLHRHDIGRTGWHNRATTRFGVINGYVDIHSGYIKDGVRGGVRLRYRDSAAFASGTGYNKRGMHGYRGNFTSTPNAIMAPRLANMSTKDDTFFNFWISAINSTEITFQWHIDTSGGWHSFYYMLIGPI